MRLSRSEQLALAGMVIGWAVSGVAALLTAHGPASSINPWHELALLVHCLLIIPVMILPALRSEHLAAAVACVLFGIPLCLTPMDPGLRLLIWGGVDVCYLLVLAVFGIGDLFEMAIPAWLVCTILAVGQPVFRAAQWKAQRSVVQHVVRAANGLARHVGEIVPPPTW